MENNKDVKPEEEKIVVNEKSPKFNVATAIVIAGVVIALAVLMRDSGAKINNSGDKLDLVSDISSDDFIRGNKGASITLIEYADFSCGFCGRYHQTLRQLISNKSNDVKWVYRNFPIFNEEAAVAGICVGKLGGNETFWNFSDELYANQDKLNPEYYLSTAEFLGVGGSDFNTCINDLAIKNKVKQEFTQNRVLLGFNATPHTVIVDKSGRKFSFAGALSYDELQAAIDGLHK